MGLLFHCMYFESIDFGEQSLVGALPVAGLARVMLLVLLVLLILRVLPALLLILIASINTNC
jgi:hypothetical protein